MKNITKIIADNKGRKRWKKCRTNVRAGKEGEEQEERKGKKSHEYIKIAALYWRPLA